MTTTTPNIPPSPPRRPPGLFCSVAECPHFTIPFRYGATWYRHMKAEHAPWPDRSPRYFCPLDGCSAHEQGFRYERDFQHHMRDCHLLFMAHAAGVESILGAVQHEETVVGNPPWFRRNFSACERVGHYVHESSGRNGEIDFYPFVFRCSDLDLLHMYPLAHHKDWSKCRQILEALWERFEGREDGTPEQERPARALVAISGMLARLVEMQQPDGLQFMAVRRAYRHVLSYRKIASTGGKNIWELKVQARCRQPRELVLHQSHLYFPALPGPPPFPHETTLIVAAPPAATFSLAPLSDEASFLLETIVRIGQHEYGVFLWPEEVVEPECVSMRGGTGDPAELDDPDSGGAAPRSAETDRRLSCPRLGTFDPSAASMEAWEVWPHIPRPAATAPPLTYPQQSYYPSAPLREASRPVPIAHTPGPAGTAPLLPYPQQSSYPSALPSQASCSVPYASSPLPGGANSQVRAAGPSLDTGAPSPAAPVADTRPAISAAVADLPSDTMMSPAAGLLHIHQGPAPQQGSMRPAGPGPLLVSPVPNTMAFTPGFDISLLLPEDQRARMHPNEHELYRFAELEQLERELTETRDRALQVPNLEAISRQADDQLQDVRRIRNEWRRIRNLLQGMGPLTRIRVQRSFNRTFDERFLSPPPPPRAPSPYRTRHSFNERSFSPRTPPPRRAPSPYRSRHSSSERSLSPRTSPPQRAPSPYRSRHSFHERSFSPCTPPPLQAPSPYRSRHSIVAGPPSPPGPDQPEPRIVTPADRLQIRWARRRRRAARWQAAVEMAYIAALRRGPFRMESVL